MERSPHAAKVLIGAAILLVAVVAAVLIARSGGGDDSGGADAISTDTSVKPDVPAQSGPPPSGLESTDVVDGDGDTAETGDTVTVQYVGVDYETGEQFDASWDNGQPFTFKLGSGQVIPGWDQGVTGMKVGGRRELIVPPDLAYGAQGSPPAIGPNATLVFVIDLLDVKSGGSPNG
ncbi:MAG: FKBP-type peptidyl-prolyl cis-trans isomerase [Solirubrobacterales bacterium]|nr:FKBP-type peptidyl-prolyl cis-trans isomerase [Solirubrobacterales bacterium]